MTTLLTLIHITVCGFLILVVLLQQGKGQDFASTFGGGGSQAAFGARGSATILTRLTTVAAVLFMITSMTLTILVSQPGTGSVITEDVVPAPAPVTAPVPAAAAPAANQAAPPTGETGAGGLAPAAGEAPGAGAETAN